MAKSNDKKQLIPTELGVHTPDTLRAGVYANVVNAGVSPGEVTINFIYANPNDTPQGTLVSRVIITRNTAREMSKLLDNVVTTADEVDPQ